MIVISNISFNAKIYEKLAFRLINAKYQFLRSFLYLSQERFN